MGARVALLNFSKGWLSPELEARFDLGAYQAGLRRATNVRIRRTGGVSKRMGTRFVAEALSSSSRLIPFQFSDTQAYALEFSQALMRPYALGGAILETGLEITAITKEATAKVTAAYHGYSVGDQVYFITDDPDAFGMIEILDRFLTVTAVIDVHNFRVDIDSTGFSPFGTDDGEVRTAPPAAPDPPPTVPPVITPPAVPPVSSGGSGGYVSVGDFSRWRPSLAARYL